MDRIYNPASPHFLQLEEMDSSGNGQCGYPFNTIRSCTAIVPELICKLRTIWMALWLGNTIAFGRCSRKDHDDKKHPDELIHFEQETVG